MAACVVCNNQVMPDDLQDAGDTTKLQSRLAQVLGEMVPVDAVMCSSCQCDLAQIEMYYTLLTVFKKRYSETAKQRNQLRESQNYDRNLLSETADCKSDDFRSIFGAVNSVQHADTHPPMVSDVTKDSKIFAPFVKLEILDVRTVREQEYSSNVRKSETTENSSDGFEDNTWESNIDESEINAPKLEKFQGLDSPSAISPDGNVKKRGRPRKTPQSIWTAVIAAKKHGRPRKDGQPKAVSSHDMVASPRKCGRPKNTEQPSPISATVSTKRMKKRGRPRKSTTPNITGPKKHGRPKTDVSSGLVETEIATGYSKKRGQPRKHEQSSGPEVGTVKNRPTRKDKPLYFEEAESEESSFEGQSSDELDADDPSYEDKAWGSSAEDSESDADDPDYGLEPLKKPSVPSSGSASSSRVESVKAKSTEGDAAGLSVTDPQPMTSQDTVVDGGSPVKKKIGRPRKIVVDAGPVVKRPRGRPRKDENNPNPSIPSRPKKYYNKPQTCKLCQKVLCSWASFKIHMAYHSEERPFKCLECGMGFKTSSCLNRHMNTHSAERRFKCKVCGKACLRRKDLEKHMSIHTDAHPYKCDQCDKSFKLPEYLKVHVKLHHVQGKQFLCSKCGYTTYTVSLLKSHMVKHNEKVKEKPWKCEKCGKCFATKVRCQHHEETHKKKATRDKHLCPICGKAVFQKYYLKMHIKQHTGDTDISCSLCNKTFTAPSGLRLHMMAHRGETPLKCEICKKGFRLTTNLKVHMMMHTDERPWKCEVCGLNFRRKPNLKDHLLTKKHREIAAKSGKSQSVNASLEQLAAQSKPLPVSLEQPTEESEPLHVSLEQPAEESLPASLEQPAEESKPLHVSLEQLAVESLPASLEQLAEESKPLHVSLEQPTAEVPPAAPLPIAPSMSVAEPLPLVIAPPATNSQYGLGPYMYFLPNEDVI